MYIYIYIIFYFRENTYDLSHKISITRIKYFTEIIETELTDTLSDD